MSNDFLKKRIAYVVVWMMIFGTFAGVTPIQVQAASNSILTVAQAMEVEADTLVTVEGYIVGFGARNKLITDPNQITGDSNIFIADSLQETNLDNAMGIRLDKKDGDQMKWGLKTNPGLIGKKIRITEVMGKYFGNPGFKKGKPSKDIQFVEGGAVEESGIQAYPAPGKIYEPIKVTLEYTTSAALTTSGPAIFYKLDGGMEQNYLESGIEVSQDTTIEAWYRQGSEESEIFTFTYDYVEIMKQSIDQVRMGAAGDKVSFEGTITHINDRNIFVQDDTAGLLIYGERTGDAGLKLGDKVDVRGTLKHYENLVEVIEADIARLEAKEEVAPQKLTIGEFLANGEAYESELIQFENVKVGVVDHEGNTWIEDATGKVAIHKLPRECMLGFDTYTVTGMGGQFKKDYQVTVTGPEGFTPIEGVQKLSDLMYKEGESLTLPQTVKVMTNGKLEEQTITWNQEDIDQVDMTKEGTYSIRGTVRDNQEIMIVVNVVSESGTRIRHIQGKDHQSPLKGQKVVDIQGVVTAFDGKDAKYGFYMQDNQPDKDEATSEGIYVRNKGAKVSIGDLVSVSGEIEERRGHTTNPFSNKPNQLLNTQITLSSDTDVTVQQQNVLLPEPILIGEGGRVCPQAIIDNDGLQEFEPQEDAIDFYESLEGMRVKVVDAISVGPTKYNEIPVVPNEGRVSYKGLTSHGGVVVTAETMHPEKIVLAKGDERNQPQVQVGQIFKGEVIGVMSYNDGNYKMLVSEPLPNPLEPKYNSNPITKLGKTEDHLRIGSFNVENLGGNAPQEKIDRIAKVVVENMGCPDIIGLEEIQDNNGKESGDAQADQTYARLIQAIEEISGTTYDYTEVEPENGKDGGQPGGNIRVGVIYRKDRVQLAEGVHGDATTAVSIMKNEEGKPELSHNPGRIDPNNEAFAHSRKPLVVEFKFKGETVFVMGNHLNSKRGDEGLFGNSQPPYLKSQVQRTKQATVLNDFIKEIIAVDEMAKIVLLGDLNDFEFSKPVNTIEGNELYNMTEKIPANKRFSYNYQGNSQVLDHIIVSKWLEPYTEVEVFNINSIKPKGEQLSDHDPSLISINMKAANEGDIQLVETTQIAEIQGASHQSSWVNQEVQDVEGIVTLVDMKSKKGKTYVNGFYMQDDTPDNDENSSEGIYVYKRGADVKVGDRVQVTGKVCEHAYNQAELSVTQIKAAVVKVVEQGVKLPQPVVLGKGGRVIPAQIIDNDHFGLFDPQEDAIDFYESLEGMYVEIEDALVVGGNKHHEIPVIANRGSGFEEVLTPHQGIVIQQDNLHPQKIFLKETLTQEQPQVKVGDVFEGKVTGVVGYDYSNYKVHVGEAYPALKEAQYEENPQSKLQPEQEDLTIASFNVENLGGDAKPEKVNALAKTIAHNLKFPDIVVLEEIQDNTGKQDDGTTQADEVYNQLLRVISAQEGAQGIHYAYTEIAPEDGKDGGQPGGNIRVGMIYRTDRVKLVEKQKGDATTAVSVVKDAEGTPSLNVNPGRIAPQNKAFEGTRKSLVAEFMFNGEKVFVVGNHLSSKRGDDAPFGAIQPPVIKTEARRIEQAKVVNEFIQSIMAVDPEAKVVVVGDLNDFEFSKTVETLKGDILVNMINTLPAHERYSYNYQGNAQVLDHILVSKALKDNTALDVIHINSVKSKDKQISDHDPAVICVDFGKQLIEQVREVQATPGSGKVNKGTKVTLQSETEGATIHYTTDGTIPTQKSPIYKEAIIVEKAMTLQAVAVKVDMIDSKCVSFNYDIKATVVDDDDDDSSTNDTSENSTSSIEKAVKQLKKEEQKEIQEAMQEMMPYTTLGKQSTPQDVKKAVKQLDKLTKDKFTDKQLEELIKNPELLEKLGIELDYVTVQLNTAQVQNFKDLKATHWAYESVKALQEKGIVAGTDQGTFNPDEALQVTDTFTFLDRTLLNRGMTTMKLPRSTVERYITNQDHWAFAHVASVSSKLSEKTLKQVATLKEEAMTRELLAQVLYEVTDGKLKRTVDNKVFTDLKDTKHKEAIMYCVETGLLQGTDKKTMAPHKVLTRAELMSVLQRVDKALAK